MTRVACHDLAKSFAGEAAVEGLDLELEPGSMTALLGPSGCGKTTTLRLIAGFERPDRGRIEFDGEPVAAPGVFRPPEKRGVGIVFQDYALFPHLTVERNVSYALGRKTDRARVSEAVARVGLTGLEGRFPADLSGGEQQRVALARALIARPGLVLLDEPLSNLDANLRVEMRAELRALLKEAEVTSVLVTHDRDEAFSLADRVAVMKDGRVRQTGDPRSVYLDPADDWVAGFTGPVNRIGGEARGGSCASDLGRLEVPAEADGPVTLIIRPEALELSSSGSGPSARVTGTEFRGPVQAVTVRTDGGIELEISCPGHEVWTPGSRVFVKVSGPVGMVAGRTGAGPS